MKRKTENGERKMGNKYISFGLLVVLFFATTWEGLAQGDLRKNAMYFSKGIESKYKDDVDGAIENFEKALQSMPDDAASMFELSEQYVKAGRVEDAFASIKKAVELDPDNKWYQMRLARFYRNFEQYADFIQVYESLTAKYPEDIDMLSELIEVYLIAGEYDSALNKLDLLETQIGHNPLISEQRLEIYKRQGKTKQEIREYIENSIGYDLSRTLEQIRPDYTFNELCQTTVPEAITCYLEGKDYEDVIRLAVSLAADADTLAAIAGPIASATEEVPNEIAQTAISLLSEEFCTTLLRFNELVAKRESEAL